MRSTRTVLLIAGYATLVIAGTLAGSWLVEFVELDVRPMNEPQAHRMVLAAAAVYVLATSLPFVPGAEIGLALLVMMGAGIVPLVYGSTVVALSLAFLVGRIVPARVTAAVLAALHLHSARDLLLRLEALDTAGRLEMLSASAPKRWVPFLLRHRYLMLGVAINLPGNTLLGGGGGIALAAGLSGLYAPLGFLATVALAVAPIPILFLLTGAHP